MGTPYKMKGSPMARNFGVGSPVHDGQATKGKIKKTFTGPIKPMMDEDSDGIPIGVDIKDTPGGKQSTPPKRKPDAPKKTKKTNKTKKENPNTNTQKKGFNYDPIPSVKDNA
jgi:hypothetical protein